MEWEEEIIRLTGVIFGGCDGTEHADADDFDGYDAGARVSRSKGRGRDVGVAYKSPMLKIKAKPIFWLLGSLRDGICFIGRTMMIRSVRMAKLAVEYQISPTWIQ